MVGHKQLQALSAHMKKAWQGLCLRCRAFYNAHPDNVLREKLNQLNDVLRERNVELHHAVNVATAAYQDARGEIGVARRETESARKYADSLVPEELEAEILGLAYQKIPSFMYGNFDIRDIERTPRMDDMFEQRHMLICHFNLSCAVDLGSNLPAKILAKQIVAKVPGQLTDLEGIITQRFGMELKQ